MAFDILYTWVDDSFPGFQDERRKFAANAHDINPQRTRDNLELLKYSLRSVERFAPWRGNIYIVAPRPQVSRWLKTDHPSIRIVHLDEFMPVEELPCFNAFAIESRIHEIASLSRRYVHFNDDMLLTGPTRREQLESEDGRLHYYFTRWLPRSERNTAKLPPFEGGRSNTHRALKKAFGPDRYPQQAHHPRIVDKQDMARLVARFPQEFAATRANRFRNHDTILPHMLLAAYLVAEKTAIFHPRSEADKLMWYVGLENYALWNRAALAWAMAHRPAFLALNDNFATPPNKRAEDVARDFLERLFPEPSSFER